MGSWGADRVRLWLVVSACVRSSIRMGLLRAWSR